MPCFARLDTRCGPMFLFVQAAVKAVLLALPSVAETGGGVPLQSPRGSTLDPESALGIGTRFEGFTIEEWARYAKTKSSIASRICKQNDKLKAEIAVSKELVPTDKLEFKLKCLDVVFRTYLFELVG